MASWKSSIFSTASTNSSGWYAISVIGSTATNLGAYTGDISHFANITSYANAVDPGLLGGINLTGALYGGVVRANGMVQVSAGELGVIDPNGNPVWLDMFSQSTGPGGVGGDVGRVSTPGSWHWGRLEAWGGVPEDYDIQLVEIGGDAGALTGATANVGVEIVADGSIGAITIGGTLYPGSVIPTWIRANSDNFGGPGYIDVLDIGGDYGALSGGDPLVGTGVGGNVRFVRVGGQIWVAGPSGNSPLTPITITGSASGSPTLITDDSGGAIQVSVGAGTTLTYRYIPIRDLGPGVAITSMDVVGASFGARVSVSVEIG